MFGRVLESFLFRDGAGEAFRACWAQGFGDLSAWSAGSGVHYTGWGPLTILTVVKGLIT